MPKIFISYRREDAEAEVTHLYGDLRRKYGAENVFFDTRTLGPGDAWGDVIHSQLIHSDVVLVIMGREWSLLEDAAEAPRLLKAEDVYRREIVTALARSPRPLVIPVLLSGVTMPRAEALPEDIADLTALNGQVLRNRDWEVDRAKLVRAINARIQKDKGADGVGAYRQRIIDETSFVSLSGIPQPRDRHGRSLQLRVPLDAIYVRVLAVAETGARASEKHELASTSQDASVASALGARFYGRRSASKPGPTKIDVLDPESVLRENDRIVVVGTPGAGKSTLLRYLARQAVQSGGGRLPLLVTLREYGTARSANAVLTLREFALAQACGENRELRHELQSSIRSGRVLWLLDGLDEARAAADQVTRECTQLPGKVVLTSRPVGYHGSGLERLVHFELLPLGATDVDRFLQHWFDILAAQRDASHSPARMLEMFKAQLDARPELAQLIRNPLMLTFLAILAGENPARELPARRSELYRRYVEELMERRESQRHAGAADDYALHEMVNGFHALGWCLHLAYYGGKSDEPPTRRRIVRDVAKHFAATAQNKAEARAEAVAAYWLEAGMLDLWTIDGEEYLVFRHLTFQEYAASIELSKLWRERPQAAWRFLKPRLHHYAWREPVLMMVAALEPVAATQAARRLLTARSRHERLLHRDLLLAGSALGEGAQIAERLAKRIVQRLEHLATRPRPWRFRRLCITFAVGLLLALAAAWSTFSAWGLFGIALLWTAIWITAFRKPVWLLRHVFTLPLRMGAAVHGRAAIISALARTRREEVLPSLTLALGDEDDVRRAAALGLARFGAPALPHLSFALSTAAWEPAAFALGQMGSSAVDTIVRLLEDPHLITRAGAARAAQYLEDARLTPALMNRLVDPEAVVRRMAADALAAIGDSAAVDALMKALGDEPRVAAAAAHALGAIGDARAVTALANVVAFTARALAEDYYDQINNAVDFIQPPPIWAPLAAAAEALGRMGGSEAVDALIAGLEMRYPAAVACAPALARIGEPKGIAAIMKALASGDSNLAHAARDALAAITEPQAVPALVEVLKNVQLSAWERNAVITALRRLMAPRELSDFVAELGSPESAALFTAPAGALESADKGVERADAGTEPLPDAASIADAVASGMAQLNAREAHVRATAATALAEVSESLSDTALVRRIECALWWRLMDGDSDVMLEAFARVAARAAVLDVYERPLSDPLLALRPQHA